MVVELPAFETCIFLGCILMMHFASEKHGYNMGYKAARRDLLRRSESVRVEH